MWFAGALPPDAPNPMDGLRDRVRALRFPVMGLAAQPSIEHFGAFSLAEGSDADGAWSITVGVTCTLWRNPDDHDDPVNLAELDDAARAALDVSPPSSRRPLRAESPVVGSEGCQYPASPPAPARGHGAGGSRRHAVRGIRPPGVSIKPPASCPPRAHAEGPGPMRIDPGPQKAAGWRHPFTPFACTHAP